MFFANAWLAPERDKGLLIAANAAHEAVPAGLDEVAGVIIERFFD